MFAFYWIDRDGEREGGSVYRKSIAYVKLYKPINTDLKVYPKTGLMAVGIRFTNQILLPNNFPIPYSNHVILNKYKIYFFEG